MFNRSIENSLESQDQIRVVKKQSIKKCKHVILYVLNQVGSKPNIGETVLHKLLYFIDFDHYEKFEETLMGAIYIKNHHGPTLSALPSILKNMEKDHEIKIVKDKYFQYKQKRFLPLKRANLELFSAREIKLIDDVLNRLSDKNAKEIEIYSHGDMPWKSTSFGEPISYESVFYRDERYSVKIEKDEL